MAKKIIRRRAEGAFTGDFTVEVLGRRYAITDPPRASQIVEDLRDRSGLGASAFPQCWIRNGNMIVGYVSYNGRVWAGHPDHEHHLIYDPYEKAHQDAYAVPQKFTRGDTHRVPREVTPSKIIRNPQDARHWCAHCRMRIHQGKLREQVGKKYYHQACAFRLGLVGRLKRQLNPRRRCDLHEEISECQASPSSCRWAGCDYTSEQGDPVCKTPAIHYDDTKSFFCDEHRKKFLKEYRWDDDEGWVERKKTNPGKKSLSQAARGKLVSMAEKATERECRRRKIQCWNSSGDAYTAKAQELFNQAYDYYEGQLLGRR